MEPVKERITLLFSNLKDPRVERRQKHPFLSVVFIGMCGALAGIETWTGLEDYTESHIDFFSGCLDLPNGVPSHDTFARVLGRLDVEAFGRCFMEFTALLQEKIPGVIAIDGKTLRGSSNAASTRAALHCVSAWSEANRLVLAQVMTEEKSNEITAIPKLLELLDLKDQTVTIDAMGCQKDIGAKIIDKGGDYILALKGNQGTLHEEVELFFKEQKGRDWKEFEGKLYEETEGDHGRIEVRHCRTTDDIGWLKERHNWKGLASIAMVESSRKIRGKTTMEQRFYISSHKADAKLIGQSIRQHWGIENKLHWVLDVTCKEDACRIRKDQAPEIMAIFRKWALNLLRKHPDKLSLRRKQHKIMMSPKYLCQYLSMKI